MDIRFEVDGHGSYVVRPHVDGIASEQFPFEADLMNERLRAHLERIELGAGICERDDLLNIGSVLWNALAPKAIRDRVTEVINAEQDGRVSIRIDLPVDGGEIEYWPWESILDAVSNYFLACHPRCSLVRTPPRDNPHAAWSRVNEGPVRILVVVPEASGLQVDYECSNLRRLAKASGNAELDVLAGKVTVSALDEKLGEAKWDILHYIGHGECSDNGEVKITFNKTPGSASDGTIDALTFAQLLAKHKLQLAVMNCCVGAAPTRSRIDAGLGPHLTRTARIPAVVAMRYEIDDNDAIGFANVLYSELFSGVNRGRIDLAVQAARRALMVNPDYTARGFATPVLYLHKGREQLFDFGAEPKIKPPKTTKRRLDLPLALIEAFQQKQVVPLVGSGLHSTEMQRRANAGGGAPTLLELVRSAADDCDYPDRAEIEFAETAGEGFLSVVMSRVFQHFQSHHQKKRLGLMQKLAGLFTRESVPDPLLSIASWDMPGFVYTHFDGLMHEALIRAHKQPCVLNIVAKEATARKEPPVLLNLRGTLRTDRVVMTESVVLTDRDHEDRFDALARPAPDVLDLLTGDGGRGVLFLGTSPRDPLLRRLCAQHLDKPDMQGPRFFVHPTVGPADEAYWQTFQVVWIRESPLAVIETLTELANQ